MPSLYFFHPSDIDDATLEALVDALHQCALDSGLFEARAIKVATMSMAHTRRGGKREPFAALQVRLFGGRSESQRIALSNALLAVINEHLDGRCNATVEMVETDRASFSR